MEYNHKFSQVSSYSHKFGFDRSVLDYPQHTNTLVAIPPESEEQVKETDISKDGTKKSRKKKTQK